MCNGIAIRPRVSLFGFDQQSGLRKALAKPLDGITFQAGIRRGAG
ncbi:hypothetical protein [Mycolicibacter kumamotonensis]|nr:hypothetical protein [Mycolicibacter kumamotonensis]